MKNVLKYFSLMLAFLLVLTGCNFSLTKKDAKETVKDSIEKNKKATNYSEKVTVDLSMDQDGRKVTANAVIDGKYFKEGDNTLVSADVKAGASGISVEGKLYADITKDSVKLYGNYDNQWFKFDSATLGEEFKKVMSELEKEDLNNVNYMDYAKEVKSVKSDKKGHDKYTVVLDKNKLNAEAVKTAEKTLEEAKKNNADSNTIAESEEYINEVKKGVFGSDVEFVLYTKNGYVSALEFDLAKMVNDVASNNAEAVAEIKKMNVTGKITIELADFGKVSKIEIPSEALKASDITTLLGGM